MQPNHITYWLRVVEGSDVSQHGVLQRSNEMTYRLREVKDETRSACYFAAIQRDHVRATAVKGQDKFRRPRFCNNQMISQYSLTKGGQKARRDQHVILLLFKLNNITYRLVVPVRAQKEKRSPCCSATIQRCHIPSEGGRRVRRGQGSVVDVQRSAHEARRA